MPDLDFIRSPARETEFPRLGRVCRLGLATRGGSGLGCEAVLETVARGVNYLNWCGRPDGMSAAIRQVGPRRDQLRVAVQIGARTAAAARRELRALLGELGTGYVDVATYYYVEHPDEWEEILAPGGAAEALESAREAGEVRAIGLTSHQRDLAARIAQIGRLDLLMIRYNAAHRGAEEQIFPVTAARAMPVVTYTGLRWGALLRPTPEDPPGFHPPRAPDCYRFVLCHPAVTVCLMAPDTSQELEEDLTLLGEWRGFSESEYAALSAHGDRVHRHAGRFP
jgi:predicted aldo/keto reductase-like oxidoreductase